MSLEDPPAYDGPRKTLAQQILDADDVETAFMDVPECGVKLELRSPTAEERAALVSSFVDMETGEAKPRDLRILYPALVIACAYDPETGERVFEMDEPTRAALNGKRGDILERIAMACMPLVGLDVEAAVEQVKGGSSTSPLNESGTP